MNGIDGDLNAYLLYGEDEREGDAGLSRRHSKPGADGEHGNSQGKQRPEKVKPYTEPSLLRDFSLTNPLNKGKRQTWFDTVIQ